MSVKRFAARLFAEAVIVPLLSTTVTKIGEAIGDRFAYKINPPTKCPICDEDLLEGHSCTPAELEVEPDETEDESQD